MIIDPRSVPAKDCYKIMIGTVVPRPIAFVSTVSEGGVHNLAPFSFYTGITSSPPTICFAPGRGKSGGRKDTLANVEDTGEFVVNVVTEEIGEAMNQTATEYPPEVDEFETAGLTPVPSELVRPPRVAESPINMECKLHQVVNVHRDQPGGGSLVIGEIVMFHVADHLIENGRILIPDLKPLGRLAGMEYTTLGDIVTLERKPYKQKQ